MSKVGYHGMRKDIQGGCSVIFSIDGVEYEYDMDCRKAEIAHWLTGKSLFKALNYSKKNARKLRRATLMDSKKVANELVLAARDLVEASGSNLLTAADASSDYRRLQVLTRQNLQEISKLLSAHAKDFKASGGRDWGFVGDLGHVNELLGEIAGFIGG